MDEFKPSFKHFIKSLWNEFKPSFIWIIKVYFYIIAAKLGS